MISALSLRKPLNLLFLLLFISPASGLAQQGPREIMAEAMSRMMEAMGLFDTAPAGAGEGSAAVWGSASDALGHSSAQDPSHAMQELMKQFAQQMTASSESGGDWSIPWKRSRLEGVWEGRNGELLVIQGSRFRIYSPAMGHVDGLIKIQGERLALYNPLDRHAKPFQFAELEGRLIMRDLDAQVYLYRRLRLDGGQGTAEARALSAQ